LRILASGKSLGATIHDVDLSVPLTQETFMEIEREIGKHGVVSFPNQDITAQHLKDFASRFGTLEVNIANAHHEPGMPEVMILSNMKKDGVPLGLSDAGQDWHTDMSYSKAIAFTNILYGVTIPFRNGVSLGNTEFCDMRAAYVGLPDSLKAKLDGLTIMHDFNKFWENMRSRGGSNRPPLSEEQRRKRPPVSHPIFLTHPISGEKVLYANPGYSMKINELSEPESQQILDYLFEHQVQEEYRYRHSWREKDVLMWDNMRTIHNAVADYSPSEYRYIKRCQVMADRYGL
jgi:taurine dioxygenase